MGLQLMANQFITIRTHNYIWRPGSSHIRKCTRNSSPADFFVFLAGPTVANITQPRFQIQLIDQRHMPLRNKPGQYESIN